MAISKKKIFKTVALPEIFPRLKNLFGSGFSNLAYMVAVVYMTVRILPANHAFLKRENKGTYSVRRVIAEASNHIQPSRKNIDQIVVFFSVIAALVIMFIQFILLATAMLIPTARAEDAPAYLESFFITPNPEEDIAFRLLDLVFGIPDFFGSKEEVDTALHQALHAMLEFYSLGMLFVGSIIILYLVVAVVAETAQSGIPFGQRFNKSWAPVRLILFFGLLIPISYGMNAGQYLALGAAKMGSGLASTGWLSFNENIIEANQTLLGRTESNIAIPNSSELGYMPGFMMITRACKLAYDALYLSNEGDPSALPAAWNPDNDEGGVRAWAVMKTQVANEDGGVSSSFVATQIGETTYQDLASSAPMSPINIVFGVKDNDNNSRHNAGVAPICGQMVLNVTDVSEPGSAVIHSAYYNLINAMWTGENVPDTDEDIPEIDSWATNYLRNNAASLGLGNGGFRDGFAPLPNEEYTLEWNQYLETFMNAEDGVIDQAVAAQIEEGDWQFPQAMRDYGWGGAGIWYNKIAQQNGALVSAIQNTPVVFLYPKIMEEIARANVRENEGMAFNERFAPVFTNSEGKFELDSSEELEISSALNKIYRYWDNDTSTISSNFTGNPVIDIINLLLGTGALFEICKNTDTHPLAQLSMLGKSMLDKSISTFAASGILGLGSIIPIAGPALGTFGAALGTFASIGLLVGFLLFYVLPFLPFIYFFFAVGNWVKGLFEAIVAIPLWALAHLRIDGEGIPGDAAIGGYFLIFEVFIRPILIVVGLIAAVTVFAAMVKVLNEAFYLIISNLSGHDPQSSELCFNNASENEAVQQVNTANRAELRDAFRGPLDQFFFTVIYTIIVYLIGTTSFKLIDAIPNQLIQRWANVEIPSFSDGAGDSAEGLMKYITIGAERFGAPVGQSMAQLGGGFKKSGQQVAEYFTN